MSDLVNLKFGENEVRIVMIADTPWWVARDVCNILCLHNVSDSLSKLMSYEKGIEEIYTLGGSQKMAIISESGLYRLIFRSNKEEAENFRKWVFEEVLPSIRKKGFYINKVPDSYMIEDPIKRAKRWIEETEEHQRRLEEVNGKLTVAEKTIEFQKPAVETYNAYLTSPSTYCLTESAKQIGIPPRKFIAWLKENRILYKKDTQSVQEPYIKLGWFTQSTYVNTSTEKVRLHKQARVTSKGLAGLRILAIKQGIIPDNVVKWDSYVLPDLNTAKVKSGFSLSNGNYGQCACDIEDTSVEELLEDFK